MKTVIKALVALTVTSTFLIAQTSPPNPANMVAHRVDYLTTALNLTAAQQQQATTIFTNAANAVSGVHRSLMTARQSLQTAIAGNDNAGIDQAAATIGGLTTQLTSIQAKAKALFYQMLTSDQQSKFTKLEARPGPSGRPGPQGGPGGSGVAH
jgi:Spy/CpxP family protein refolding chaperone